jgi:hypothetical protein
MAISERDFREHKRYSIKGVTIRYTPSSILKIFNDTSKEYAILNISQAGLQFITTRRYEKGTDLALTISTTQPRRIIIRTQGQIVWVKQPSKLHLYVVGVKFTSMLKENHNKLETIINHARSAKYKNQDEMLHKLVQLQAKASIKNAISRKIKD